MKNFTFKKHIPEGRYRSFELDHTDIKRNKKVVGFIGESRKGLWEERYRIHFQIKKEITKEEPAPFRWIELKKRCNTEKEAREFIKKNSEEIQILYDLYEQEND